VNEYLKEIKPKENSMNIVAEDVGKKFGKNWIFRHLNFEIEPGSCVAITGKNGSGKSTLLQLIGGYLSPSQGQLRYGAHNTLDSVSVAFVGPYTDLIEEVTLMEFLQFHSRFRDLKVPFEEMADRANLPLNKLIGDFSTGMKQRVKLITAFFFDNEIVFFDEPTANLDEEGTGWWAKETMEIKTKVVVIASNQAHEISHCTSTINL